MIADSTRPKAAPPARIGHSVSTSTALVTWVVALVLLTTVGSAQAPTAAVAADAEPTPKIHGAPAAFGTFERQEEITIAAGTPLFQSPARRAPRIVRLDAEMTVPVFEWRGAWARVRAADSIGWMLSESKLAAGETAVPLQALPAILQPTAFDPAQLADVRHALGDDHQQTQAAGFAIYADIAPTRLVRLRQVLLHLDQAMVTRLGGMSGTPRAEAIVIFADQADYLRYLRDDAPARGSARRLGQAMDGLAVMSADGLSIDQLEMLVVHEASHLVTRRILGLGLPPWLEEGLAEDIAYHQRDDAGITIPGSLIAAHDVRMSETRLAGGRLVFLERSLGGRSALETLITTRTPGARVGLADWVSMRGAAFNASEDPKRYPIVGFWMRFLLDTARDRVLLFLDAVRRGDAADEPTLLRALESDWPTLEADFETWLDALWIDTRSLGES